MAKPNVLILRAPGTNCDAETAFAFESAGCRAEILHVGRLLESPSRLDGYQVLAIPGGFSYGDDLGAGRIFATHLRGDLGEAFIRFRDRDTLTLGICNGFQVLQAAGLIVEPDAAGEPRATLALNAHGRYEDRWVWVEFLGGRTPFVRESVRMALPIAHAEGRFLTRSPEILTALVADRRIIGRYVDAEGREGPFPINPNGSMGSVAAACDATGRVFALMPHPERHLFGWHHPEWTRQPDVRTWGDGFTLFQNAAAYFS